MFVLCSSLQRCFYFTKKILETNVRGIFKRTWIEKGADGHTEKRILEEVRYIFVREIALKGKK